MSLAPARATSVMSEKGPEGNWNNRSKCHRQADDGLEHDRVSSHVRSEMKASAYGREIRAPDQSDFIAFATRSQFHEVMRVIFILTLNPMNRVQKRSDICRDG